MTTPSVAGPIRVATPEASNLDEAGVRIVDAALTIAVERGYQGTTLQRIARAADLPVSSLYWRFSSKDDLMAAAMRWGFSRWGRNGQPSLLPSTIRAGTDHGARPAPVVQIALPLVLTADPTASESRAAFVEIRASAEARIAEDFRWLTDGVDRAFGDEVTRTLARLWIMAIDGLIAGAQDPGDRDDEGLMRLLLTGVEGLGRRLVERSVATAHRADPAPDEERPARPTAAESGRERLLCAASELLAESGYDATTISGVCERAGVPRSSLYWHFTDKDDLVAAVVRDSFLAFTARTTPLPSPTRQAQWQDGLRVWLRGSQGTLWRGADFARIGLMLLFERRAPEPAGRALFRRIRQRSTSILSGWFAGALPAEVVLARPELPSQLAWLVIWFADAIAVSRQTTSIAADSNDVAELVVHVIDVIVADAAAHEGLTVDSLAHRPARSGTPPGRGRRTQ